MFSTKEVTVPVLVSSLTTELLTTAQILPRPSHLSRIEWIVLLGLIAVLCGALAVYLRRRKGWTSLVFMALFGFAGTVCFVTLILAMLHPS
jgi:hypothetical protein